MALRSSRFVVQLRSDDFGNLIAVDVIDRNKDGRIVATFHPRTYLTMSTSLAAAEREAARAAHRYCATGNGQD